MRGPVLWVVLLGCEGAGPRSSREPPSAAEEPARQPISGADVFAAQPSRAADDLPAISELPPSTVRWESRTSTRPTAIARDERLVLFADGNAVRALDVATGRSEWARRLDFVPSRIDPVADRVLVESADGEVVSLSKAGGAVEWRAETACRLPAGLVGGAQWAGGYCVAGGTVDVAGIDLETGRVVWRYPLGDAGGSIESRRFPELASDGRAVFVVNVFGGDVSAFDLRTGLLTWWRRGAPDRLLSDRGAVLALAGDAVTAFSAESGRDLWRVGVAAPHGSFFDSNGAFVAGSFASVVDHELILRNVTTGIVARSTPIPRDPPSVPGGFETRVEASGDRALVWKSGRDMHHSDFLLVVEGDAVRAHRMPPGGFLFGDTVLLWSEGRLRAFDPQR